MHVLCNAVDVVEPCEVPLCLKKTSFDLVGMPTVHLAVNVSSPALEGNSSVYILYIICVYIYIILSIILKTSGESMAFAYLQCVCCNTLEAASIPSVLSEDRRAVIISSETGSGQLSRWCFGWKSTTYFTYFLPREVQHQWTRGYCIKCWMFVEYCSQILMHWRTESWACSLNKTCLL